MQLCEFTRNYWKNSGVKFEKGLYCVVDVNTTKVGPRVLIIMNDASLVKNG